MCFVVPNTISSLSLAIGPRHPRSSLCRGPHRGHRHSHALFHPRGNFCQQREDLRDGDVDIRFTHSVWEDAHFSVHRPEREGDEQTEVERLLHHEQHESPDQALSASASPEAARAHHPTPRPIPRPIPSRPTTRPPSTWTATWRRPSRRPTQISPRVKSRRLNAVRPKARPRPAAARPPHPP